MQTTYAIKTPQILHFPNGQTNTFYGGDQAWYKSFWKRMAGCGPTTAAHLLFYLSRTREEYAKLTPWHDRGKQGFLRMMNITWQYVTPGMQGVNSTDMFIKGIREYCKDHQIKLAAHTLEIPPKEKKRPQKEEVSRFLQTAFQLDLPIAFLNLDHGGLPNLESWHWVTLVAWDPLHSQATMYDQAKADKINLDQWLNSTRQGGGFVALRPV